MGTAIKLAYALIDWHNVQGYVNPKFESHPRYRLADALLRIQQQVALALAHSRFAAGKFRVTLRIYHGWHQARDPMPVRREFEALATDEGLARRFSNVSFTRGFQFGNELACLTGTYPLYSTYRGSGQAV